MIMNDEYEWIFGDLCAKNEKIMNNLSQHNWISPNTSQILFICQSKSGVHLKCK
jgi:hypothetical protein